MNSQPPSDTDDGAKNAAATSSAPASTVKNPYKVLVVDDSAVIRGLISRALRADPKVEVTTSAANGELAITALEKNSDIEIIVLDIEMPVMDGLTAIPKLLEVRADVQIIMASTLTTRNAEISFQALAAGAVDYLPKPTSASGLGSTDDFSLELIHKVKALGAAGRRRRNLPPPEDTSAEPGALAEDEIKPLARSPGVVRTEGASAIRAPIPKKGEPISLRKAPYITPSALAVGSSTGGPQALMTFFKEFQPNTRQPVFITQHMPPKFTEILAQQIERMTGWTCFEAQEGMIVEGAKIYLAPGGKHMTAVREGNDVKIRLNEEPPENYCRPSVDPMLRSLIKAYDKKVLCVMLTGMGHDGLGSARMLVEAGGNVIAQDEKTSVVWGMPGAVAADGICNAVLPLTELAHKTESILKSGGRG